jgi:hypothetical protein
LRSNFECRVAGLSCFRAIERENIVEVELKYSLGWPELEGDEVPVHPPVGGLEPSDCHLAVFFDDICGFEDLVALLKYFEMVLLAVGGVGWRERKGKGRQK